MKIRFKDDDLKTESKSAKLEKLGAERWKSGEAEKWKSGGGWKAVQGMSVAHRESSCEGGRVRSDFEVDHYQPSWYQKISEF